MVPQHFNDKQIIMLSQQFWFKSIPRAKSLKQIMRTGKSIVIIYGPVFLMWQLRKWKLYESDMLEELHFSPN